MEQYGARIWYEYQQSWEDDLSQPCKSKTAWNDSDAGNFPHVVQFGGQVLIVWAFSRKGGVQMMKGLL